MTKQLIPPILLLAFNRPETTRLVFDEIRKTKPKEFFVSVDGPRNSAEKIKVDEVKKIVSNIDWPCKLKTKFNKKNLGMGVGILSAINWFFENVEEGIILEDDGLPNQDFFRFCEEMLEKYRNNEKIMHINGCNFQRGWLNTKDSYYFSIFPHTYGWAMWRDKRKKYDDKMKEYLKLRKKFKIIFPNIFVRKYIIRIMDYAYRNPNAIDTQWMFSVLKNRGVCITPNKNLIQGIGFSKEATNTKFDFYLSLPTEKLEFPLKHPSEIVLNRKADERYVRWLLRNKLKKYFLMKTGLHKLLNK